MKILLLIFIMQIAYAELPQKEVSEQAEAVSEALEIQDRQGRSSVSLSTVRIRTILDAGIEIPGVTNAKLSPEIEFFFTKNSR